MRSILKTLFITLTVLMTISTSSAAKPKNNTPVSEARSVREIIDRVNTYWQGNNPADVSAIWDNAAYHTGNMEVWFLTGNEKCLEYSQKWAEYNSWSGAKGQDKSQWKYSYGESDEYVLFGDQQTCFQTFIDLYNIAPADYKIARALEVMRYQMSTPQKDYWWWCDALYMVMPVMTKLYKLTGDAKFLDKLYEYLEYADSIMYDEETGLYFRDAKYVFPNHRSANGKKDFWARGEGWVLAGLAKVLKDMPVDYAHYDFFVDKYTKMAATIAGIQQSEGYWTRSILDPEFAPGPETSGTAFLTYGLLWGVNNGYLEKEQYKPVIDRAWSYLKNTALQKDGRIGYVQPIGERAIAGQKLDATSTSNFGVGAFLLAACEYVRFLEGQDNPDRQYWCSILYKLAEPVLENMSKGELQSNMMVETSPTWDGRDIRVTYMETFGRLMAGIAPWLNLPDDDSQEGQMRSRLRSMALRCYANAVDPDSPDYLLWRKEGQPLVDAAYVAESFIRGYERLWLPLDEVTKQRYIEEFTLMRRVDPPYSNWLLFSSLIESFLAKVGAPYDAYRINSAIRKVEEWYIGDGWYADGPTFAFDFYSSYVFHPMYLETLKTMMDAGAYTRIYYPEYYSRALRRTQRFGIVLERLISPEGTFPVFGRSITYRMATMQPLAMLSLNRQLPPSLSQGQVRAALTAVLHRMFDGTDLFNEKGFLSIGFTSPTQKDIADWYTNNGSLYMTSLVLLPLGLPASHPFWTDASQPWTSKKAWSGLPFPKDKQWKDGAPSKDLF